MSRNKNGTPPRYRLHKPSGQAVVTIEGHDQYLGRYGSPDSHQKYEQLVRTWRSRLREGAGDSAKNNLLNIAPDQVMVSEILLLYIRYAKTYYKHSSNGEQKEVGCLRNALKLVRRLYGRAPIADFGPKALKEVRTAMINKGWSRSYINHQIDRVKRMFRWATEEELIPPSVYHALQSVRGLRKGLPGVRESKKVRPVPPRLIKKMLNYVQPMIRAMILFQFHTGCRPDEVCRLKPKKITYLPNVWVYRPGRHKTAHHGKKRTIFIGPRGQKVLEPWLMGIAQEEYVFSPIRSEALRNSRRRANRQTPCWPSHLTRLAQKRKLSPRRCKRKRYDSASYRRAIKRACAVAKVPSWSPNQLRHTAATRIRRRHGIELARIILGHTTAFTTEIYAETDRKKAMDIIGQMG